MKKKEDFIGVSQREYCPFIREKSEELLLRLLKDQNPESILEIGTFLGYSASLMLENCPQASLVTVEKNSSNAEFAKQNLQNFEERVRIENCDAMQFLEANCDMRFDFIFLDGPKGQYVKYLPFLKKMLKIGGVLVADDVLFYGLVNSDEKIDHKHRALVNNLRKFLYEIQNDDDFETIIYDFDDGISVSRKIK